MKINLNKSYTFINLTPHDIKLFNQNNRMVTIEKSGQVARVSNRENETVGTIYVNGVPIKVTQESDYGNVIGLPAQQDNVLYFVSGLVKQALPNRHDLIVSDELIRDNTGFVVGANAIRI